MVEVGDLVRCDDEVALVLAVTRPTGACAEQLWLECLWPSGNIEGIDVEYVELC